MAQKNNKNQKRDYIPLSKEELEALRRAKVERKLWVKKRERERKRNIEDYVNAVIGYEHYKKGLVKQTYPDLRKKGIKISETASKIEEIARNNGLKVYDTNDTGIEFNPNYVLIYAGNNNNRVTGFLKKITEEGIFSEGDSVFLEDDFNCSGTLVYNKAHYKNGRFYFKIRVMWNIDGRPIGKEQEFSVKKGHLLDLLFNDFKKCNADVFFSKFIRGRGHDDPRSTDEKIKQFYSKHKKGERVILPEQENILKLINEYVHAMRKAVTVSPLFLETLFLGKKKYHVRSSMKDILLEICDKSEKVQYVILVPEQNK